MFKKRKVLMPMFMLFFALVAFVAHLAGSEHGESVAEMIFRTLLLVYLLFSMKGK